MGVITSKQSNATKPGLITLTQTGDAKTQSMLFSFKAVSWPRQGGSTDFGPALLINNDHEYVVLRIRAGEDTVTLCRKERGRDDLIPLYPDGVKRSPLGVVGSASASPSLKQKFSDNLFYWCRIEYGDFKRQFRFRIWEARDGEPEEWTAVYTLGSGFTAEEVDWRSGSQGFMLYQTSPFKVWIRSVYVYHGQTEEYQRNSAGDAWAPDVDTMGSYPLTDTFNRAETTGWGWGGSAALWTGSVLDQPLLPGKSGFGYTENGSAKIDFNEAYTLNTGVWGFLGNTIRENRRMEIAVTFRAAGLNKEGVLRIGPRGREGLYRGAVSGVGYALQIPLRTSGGKMKLVRKTSLTANDWTEMTGQESGDVVEKSLRLVEGKDYHVKVQIRRNDLKGFELRAKLWQDGTAEPSTFDLVYRNPDAVQIDKGTPFINVQAGASGARVVLLKVSATVALTPEELLPPRAEVPFTLINLIEQENDFVIEGSNPPVYYIRPVIEYTGRLDNAEVTLSWWPKGTGLSQIRSLSLLDEELQPLEANQSIKRLGVSTSRADADEVIAGKLVKLTGNTTYIFEVKIEHPNFPATSIRKNWTTRFAGVWIDRVITHDVTHNAFTVAALMRDEVTQRAFADTTMLLELRNVTDDGAWEVVDAGDITKWADADGNGRFGGYAARNFSATLSGLLSDHTYKYRVTITDAQGGINGDPDDSTSDAYSGTITTFGAKPAIEYIDPTTGLEMYPVEVIAETTSARVIVHYRWDVNDDIEIKLSYREYGRDALMEFSTIYQNDPRRFLRNVSNPLAKSWEARLIGLVPGVEYQVNVVVTHPSGTISGETSYSVLFTTQQPDPMVSRRGKHYLFKVYDPNSGEYLGTWNDIGQPKFSLNENGGVSDLSLKLPRLASDVSTDRTIALGNRVDIWVIDHTSDGMGRNLVTDPDFDLGGWFTAGGWLVGPAAGIDGKAGLRLHNATSANVALSGYIELSNPTGQATKYQVILGISPLIRQYKNDLDNKNPNYKNISRLLKADLQNLFPERFLAVNAAVINPQIERIINPTSGLIRLAATKKKWSLFDSVELAFVTDNQAAVESIKDAAEAEGCQVSVNEQVNVTTVPYVLQLAAKAVRGQITAQVEYFDVVDPNAGVINNMVSAEAVSTDGDKWQILKLVFEPPTGTRTMRVRITAQGDNPAGVIDKVQVLPQELLIYRGKIETIKTSIDEKGESINLEVMGLVSQLTDIYIQFKQWVERQPSQDQPKYKDMQFAEDTAPPPTYTTETNRIKVRESPNDPLNKWAILFPEIGQDYVLVRVYYDGDDNKTGRCMLYYTSNMDAVFPGNSFTTVSANQYVYTSKEVVMRATPSSKGVAIKTLPKNTRLVVLSESIEGANNETYKWINVRDSAKDEGWVPFEFCTPTSGSTTQTGLRAIVVPLG